MVVKKVEIEPGCITCGLCEFIAPDIFQVTDICHVKKNNNLDAHAKAIQEAAERCPVQVIAIEDLNNDESNNK